MYSHGFLLATKQQPGSPNTTSQSSLWTLNRIFFGGVLQWIQAAVTTGQLGMSNKVLIFLLSWDESLVFQSDLPLYTQCLGWWHNYLSSHINQSWKSSYISFHPSSPSLDILMLTKFDLLYKPCCHCLRLGSRPAWTLGDTVLLFCRQSCTPYCSFQRSKWRRAILKHTVYTRLSLSFFWSVWMQRNPQSLQMSKWDFPLLKKKSTLPALCLPSALTVCQTQQVLTPLLLGPQ